MTVKLFRSIEPLIRYEMVWNEAADRVGLPMARTEWLLSAYEQLTEPHERLIVLVTDTDERFLAGIALVSHPKSRSGCHNEIVGSSRLYEPNSPVYLSQRGLECLISALGRLDRPSILLRIWPGTLTSRSCRVAVDSIHFKRSSAASQHLPVNGSYENYLASLTAQKRYDLRRAARRAEAAGHMCFEYIKPEPEQIDHWLNIAVAVEQKSWKGQSGSALADDNVLLGFFKQMLKRYAALDGVYFAFLRLDEVVIAMQFGLEYMNKLWILKVGYDQSYSKLSPGLLLMDLVVQRAHNESLSGVEFLGSSERWVNTWQPEERGYFSLAIYPYRARCLFDLAKMSGKVLIDRLTDNK